MGRGQKRGRTQRRHFKQSRENVWKHDNTKKTRPEDGDATAVDNRNSAWEPFATQNPAFEEYYKGQSIVPEEEWEEFMCVLRKPLPAAFRINSSGQFFRDIQAQMENDFMKSLEVSNGYEVEAIRPLPWYPGNLAWHLNFSRMQLRKNQTLESFHEFLKQENEVGNITRQEAVSMVPPLFLDILPEHHVLDMCAAPGSKTFQLLEMMHQSAEPGLLPNGLVIANDVDVQRCNLLIHQTKRMCSANLIVTNHEAQHFPCCRHFTSNSLDICMTKDLNGGSTSRPPTYRDAEQLRVNGLQFDRVLCDVPCSGDGTLRKAPDIWRKWNAGMGNGFHHLQVQIAMRGLALLKVGGRMVYSTCSMNPVENEAVVAEVLRRGGGSVELLDVSRELPELIRRPGLTKWKVRDKGLWFKSYRDVPTYRKGGIVPSMFPSGQGCEVKKSLDNDVQVDTGTPDNSTALELNSRKHQVDCSQDQEHNSNILGNTATLADVGRTSSETEIISDRNVCSEEVSSLPLERCIRIVPHDQNSGAFFIAVLQKLTPLQENNSSQSKRSTIGRQELSKTNIVRDEGEPQPEISNENAPGSQNHVAIELASDADLQVKDAESKAIEVSLDMEIDGESSKENNAKETEACNVGDSGLEVAKAAKGRSQVQGKWRGVDPVLFFRDDSTINSIRAFYGIAESFPLDGHLVMRNNDANHVKRIYYISKSVHDVLELNFGVGQPFKITSLGLKIFERQTSKDAYSSSPCAFRISSEGLPLLLPYISKQIISASLTDFQNLLKYRSIKFSEFVDVDFGEKASKLLLGCCVVVLNTGDQTTDNISVDASTIAIGCWKGKTNLSVMVSQMDGKELLERVSKRLGVEKVTSVEENGKASIETDMIDSEDAEFGDDVKAEEQEIC